MMPSTPVTPLQAMTSPISIPTLLIGLGGIGSHTVAAVYRKLKAHSQAPLGALAIDADPYTLFEITDCPIVALRGSKTLKDAYESLPIEEKKAMFESPDALDAPAYRDYASERPIYLRKNAYLVYRAVQSDGRLRQLTEALKHFSDENPNISPLRVYLVSTTFGCLGSALLQPIAHEVAAFLKQRGLQIELRAFLLPPDHTTSSAITPDCYDKMLARSHACVKEIALLHHKPISTLAHRLLTFSGDEEKPLFSQIILASTPLDHSNIRLLSKRFEAALCGELLQTPRFTRETACRKLSVAKLVVEKTELYEALVLKAINAYRKFPAYKGVEAYPDTANNDGAKSFLAHLERIVNTATETDAEKTLIEALTVTPYQKPRFLHKRADTERLTDTLHNELGRINAAISHYLDFDLRTIDKAFRTAIDALFANDNSDALVSLGILKDRDRYASPERAELSLRRVCSETAHRLYTVESLPSSPPRIEVKKSDTPYYTLCQLSESLSALRERVIEAKRNALRALAYRYLERRLAALLDRYHKGLERLIAQSPLRADEMRHPDCYTVELNDDEISYEAVKVAVFSHLDHTLGRAFYTDTEDIEPLLDCRDALREHPLFSSFFQTSILERIYREEPEAFPKRFAELVRDLPHTREHTLASVILHENEVAFLQRYQDTVMPPEANLYDLRPYPRPDPITFFFDACGISPSETVVLSDPAYQEKIDFLYATPFVSLKDLPHLTPNITDQLAEDAYNRLQNADLTQRTVNDPHLFAALNQIED